MCEAVQNGCIHVHELHAGMIGHEMATARFAEFSLSLLGFVKTADVRFAFGDPDAVGRPERKSIDRRSRPTFAVFAMALAHDRWDAGRFKFYLAAKARPFVHVLHRLALPSLVQRAGAGQCAW